MNQQQFEIDFFGEPVNWNYNHHEAKIQQRVNQASPQLLHRIETIEAQPIPVVVTAKTINSFGASVMGFASDDHAKPNLKRSSDAPDSPPKRIAVESSQELQEEPVLNDANVIEEPAIGIPSVEIPEPEVQNKPEGKSSSEKSSSSSEEESNEEKEEVLDKEAEEEEAEEEIVDEGEDEEDAGEKSMFDHLQLLEKFKHVFTGEFEIPIVTDEIPFADAYEDDVIEIRRPEVTRKRREPKRYNDEDFKDDEEEENGKGKKNKGKNAPSLAKQLNMVKGSIILDDVTDATALGLLEKLEPFKLFEISTNRALQNNKANLSKAMPSQAPGYYDTAKMFKTPDGLLLASYIRNAIRNFIAVKANRSYARHKNYTMINELSAKIHEEMSSTIDNFQLFTKLEPNAEVPEEMLPFNSLRLVLMYNGMQAVKETGFDDKATYIVKFFWLRDLSSKEERFRIFRVKYQQMVQLRALYYLVNPLNLIDNIACSFAIRCISKTPKLLESLPEKKSEELEALFKFIATEDTVQALLTEFVFVISNFEAYFQGTRVKNFLNPYSIYNTETLFSKTATISAKNTLNKLN
jgi:hypothetical protein